MFLRNEKKSPGWGFIALGLFFCALALLLQAGVFGPVPESGRGETFAFLGIPLGVVSIVIGIVTLVREGNAPSE